MWKTIFRRFVLMIPQLFILSLLVFLIGLVMPGDAFTGLIDPSIKPEQIEAARERAGLNLPWHIRYFNWISGIFHGDFGNSFKYKQPVVDIIGDRIFTTMWLSLFATFLTYLIGLPLGLIAGRHENSIRDRVIGFYSFFAMALPTFVLGLLLIWLFGYTLDWFPTRGSVDANVPVGTFEYILSRMYHMILPAIAMAIVRPSGIIQFLRASVIDAQEEDFVRTARAKGVPESVVYRRHIFRNSILPIASTFGYTITGLFSGSVITETIFSFQGMGLLFFSSVNGRDFNVMLALILFFGFLTLLGGLLSDIIMVFVDPRIRIN